MMGRKVAQNIKVMFIKCHHLVDNQTQTIFLLDRAEEERSALPSKPKLRRLLCQSLFRIWLRGCSPVIHHHGSLNPHETEYRWARRPGSSPIRDLIVVDGIVIVTEIVAGVGLTVANSGKDEGSVSPEVVAATIDGMTVDLITATRGDEGTSEQTSVLAVVGHALQSVNGSRNQNGSRSQSRSQSQGRQLK